MMLVQKFLELKTLVELKDEHGIKSRVAGHKVSLNYSQIEAVDSELISQQCRGLILRRKDKGVIDPSLPLGKSVVLARPMDRFFNLGQDAAAEVDLRDPRTRFFEKLDGTMCILYFDDVVGAWHVATRSIPEADLFIDGFESFTFRSLFDRSILEMTGLAFPAWSNALDTSVSFMFELTTPINRIVVSYEKFGVTLLGARITATGQDLDPVCIAPELRVPHATVHRLRSGHEIVDFVSGRDPMKHEGIVACDAQYRRVKIKSSGYLALNRIRDSVMSSPRALLELVLLNKFDDATGLLQECYIALGRKMQSSLRKIFREADEVYAECLHEANLAMEQSGVQLDHARLHRKAFALAVVAHSGWMAPMMSIYNGQTDGVHGWIDAKQGKNGGWSNSFLDYVLRLMGM